MEVKESMQEKKVRKPGGGRKKIADKKITVSIFPRMSMIEKLGIYNLKEIAISAVEKEYAKSFKK